MSLEEAIQTIFSGEALLFCGSGFSLGATNIKDEKFKKAGELSKSLMKDCGFDDEISLDQAAEEYIEAKGETGLIEFLLSEFRVKAISDDQKIIGDQKWQRIYTTNYDDIIEKAYGTRMLQSVTLANDPSVYDDKAKLCVHLNGFIENLNYKTLLNEFKLTNTSYLTEDFVKSKWVRQFRSDLTLCKAIIFIGFSMDYDLDISRIINHTNPDIYNKVFFITHEQSTSLQVRRLERFGQVFPINLSGFTKKLIEEKKLFKPTPLKFIPLLSFKKTEQHRNPPATINNSDVDDLLVKGIIRESFVNYSINQPEDYKYIIRRDKLSEVIDNIATNDFIIHSDLGNGKTLFIESLKYLLDKKGYPVFKYINYSARTLQEIDEICKKHQDAIFIVDNFRQNKDIVEQIVQYRTQKQRIILTERTNIYESTQSIEEMLLDPLSISLNRLSDSEIKEIIGLINKYGFWQDKIGFDTYKKEEYIKDTLKSSLKYVLLDIIKSTEIIGRYKTLIHSLKEQKGYYDAVLYLLISNFFNFNNDVDGFLYSIDSKLLNNPNFIKNPVIKELIDFKANEFNLKSSILSEVLLKQISQPDTIISLITDVFLRLDQQILNQTVKSQLISLMLCSNLQKLVGNENIDAIIRFYQNIERANYCKDNLDYWLQFSIAKIVLSDFDAADRYIENAKTLAKKIGYKKTYRLDHHKARIQIEQICTNKDTPTKAMEVLDQVQMVLAFPPSRELAKHYPFKVAQKYKVFYSIYFSELKPDDQKTFLDYCMALLDRIEWYERNIQDQEYVHNVYYAKKSLQEILSQHTPMA
jgi:hypothetical protein